MKIEWCKTCIHLEKKPDSCWLACKSIYGKVTKGAIVVACDKKEGTLLNSGIENSGYSCSIVVVEIDINLDTWCPKKKSLDLEFCANFFF